MITPQKDVTPEDIVIQRVYITEEYPKESILDWEYHEFESRYIVVLKGSLKAVVIPKKNMEPEITHLEPGDCKMVYSQSYLGMKVKEPAILLIISNMTEEESRRDCKEFGPDWFGRKFW